MFHSPSLPGRWLCALACVLALLWLPDNADAARRARAAVMINLSTGKVLYEHNPNLSIPPASLTKVMTMYLTLDRIKTGRLKRNTTFRVHPTARVGGSKIRLRPRQQVSVDQLLYGMAVASGNDAAMAISQHISGNSRNFTAQMNRKARQLGMKKTVFKNPTGLPAAGQRTTARDMATLARAYLRNHPQALRYHKQRSFRFNGRTLGATNTLLGINGVDGLKTGWTVASGYNIIVTARRGKTRLLIVVMGGRSRNARDMVARELLEAGFKTPASPAQVRKCMRGIL
ncbi:D-alanyl-D-alanine carboxypeptidase family protein [uncultured Desulfovibrio sp.]|uniref:D-alanyl-D-alanine carboxypeptidase family protein n=1 Tax=uncultured Desulfovibrio sp. TaxID=167968 RepID=UPI00260B28C7|nr:D-alanyl-D-alanine carboxypeptidase family protein [uncultured Desulfovibrio sp.]